MVALMWNGVSQDIPCWASVVSPSLPGTGQTAQCVRQAQGFHSLQAPWGSSVNLKGM